MFPSRPNRLATVLITAVLLTWLAACSGPATPQLIGAYRPAASPPIATFVPPPANALVVYDGTLTLEVHDVAAAATAAADLAYHYGGYPASTQTWFEGSDRNARLTLAVPVAQFDALRAAVLNLGRLAGEHVSGDLVSLPPGASAWSVYAHLTLHLVPAARPALRLPPVPDWGWSPARTFSRAFEVFAALFTFLVDALIWLSVVVGPFVLLGLGLRWLVRGLRWPAPPQDKS